MRFAVILLCLLTLGDALVVKRTPGDVSDIPRIGSLSDAIIDYQAGRMTAGQLENWIYSRSPPEQSADSDLMDSIYQQLSEEERLIVDACVRGIAPEAYRQMPKDLSLVENKNHPDLYHKCTIETFLASAPEEKAAVANAASDQKAAEQQTTHGTTSPEQQGAEVGEQVQQPPGGNFPQNFAENVGNGITAAIMLGAPFAWDQLKPAAAGD